MTDEPTSPHDGGRPGADRLGAELAALRSSVEATVDVDAALEALHRDAGSDDRRSGRARWLRVAASIAASIAVLGGGLAVWQLRDDGVTVTADRVPDMSLDADPLEDFCAGQPRFVYLVPSATPEQERAVAAALEDIEGVGRIVHLDRDATYEEFQRLFADQPELFESSRPEGLPTSYRVWSEPGATEAVEELAALPAVLRVERGEQYLCDESGRFTSVGFRIFIDGEPVPAREIAGALANVVTTGSDDHVGQFERIAAAHAVSNRLLTDPRPAPRRTRDRGGHHGCDPGGRLPRGLAGAGPTDRSRRCRRRPRRAGEGRGGTRTVPGVGAAVGRAHLRRPRSGRRPPGVVRRAARPSWRRGVDAVGCDVARRSGRPRVRLAGGVTDSHCRHRRCATIDR